MGFALTNVWFAQIVEELNLHTYLNRVNRIFIHREDTVKHFEVNVTGIH
jgi:hypothetical protein